MTAKCARTEGQRELAQYRKLVLEHWKKRLERILNLVSYEIGSKRCTIDHETIDRKDNKRREKDTPGFMSLETTFDKSEKKDSLRVLRNKKTSKTLVGYCPLLKAYLCRTKWKRVLSSNMLQLNLKKHLSIVHSNQLLSVLVLITVCSRVFHWIFFVDNIQKDKLDKLRTH